MRVISQDKLNNVPYEGNTFCIVSDNEKEEYSIVVRGANLNMYMPLATYKSMKAAQKIFDDMIAAGERSMIPNGTFEIPV